MRFTKPLKGQTALSAISAEAAKKKKNNKKKKDKNKVTAYSKYVPFPLSAFSEQSFLIKLSNPALKLVKDGKSVKASLSIETLSASGASGSTTIAATLKKAKKSKKKK